MTDFRVTFRVQPRAMYPHRPRSVTTVVTAATPEAAAVALERVNNLYGLDIKPSDLTTVEAA